MGLPKGCAQTHNCTGLLVLCLHPSHQQAAGAPAVRAARPRACRDSTKAETPNLPSSTKVFWSQVPFLSPWSGGDTSRCAALCLGHGCLRLRLLPSSWHCRAGMRAANEPQPQLCSLPQGCPLSFLPLFFGHGFICTPAETAAGWHSPCGDGRARQGRGQCPWGAGTQHRVLGPAGAGDTLQRQCLPLPAFPCLVALLEAEQHVCIPILVLEMQYL